MEVVEGPCLDKKACHCEEVWLSCGINAAAASHMIFLFIIFKYAIMPTVIQLLEKVMQCPKG